MLFEHFFRSDKLSVSTKAKKITAILIILILALTQPLYLFMFKTTAAAAPYVVEDITPANPAPVFTLNPKLLGNINYYNFIKPVDVAAATVLGEKVYFVADEGNGATNGKITYISDSKNFEITENINKPIKVCTAFNEFLIVLDTEGDTQSPNFGKSVLLMYAFRTITAPPDTHGITIEFLNKLPFDSSTVIDFCINESSRISYFIESDDRRINYFLLPSSDDIRDGSPLSFSTLSSGAFSVAGVGSEMPVALAYGNDNVHALFSGSVCSIGTTSLHLDQTRRIAALDQPIDIAYANGVFYVSDNYGIKSFYNNGYSDLLGKTVTTVAISSGELKQPCGLFADENNALLITDTSAGGRCVQRFLINNSGNSLQYNGLLLGSLGYDTGRVYEPYGITSKNGIVYVVDTKNKRVQVWSGDNVTTITPAQLMLPVAAAAGFSAESTALYVVDSFNKILEIAEDGSVKSYTTGGGAAFSYIGDIATAIDGTVYVADKGRNKVYSKKLDETEFSVFADIPEPLSVSVSVRSSNVYITQNTSAGAGVVSAYAPDGAELTDRKISLPDITVIDIALDYNDTVFALVDDGGAKLLKRFKINDDGDRYLLTDLQNDGKYNLDDILSISINEMTGELVIADALNNVVFFVDRAQTEAAPISEPPPVPILPANQPLEADNPVAICTVLRFPSTVLYPIDPMYEQPLHPYYPTGFAHTNIQYMPVQTSLLVLGSSESNLFYYVLYNGKAGFILKNGARLEEPTPPPYVDGTILHAEATVFKYPVLTKNNSGYDFKITTLNKGERITLVGTVNNYQENGVFWYEVLYTTRAGVSKGYVQRYQITPDLNRDDTTQVFGRIKAEINVGLVGVFDKKDENEQPFIMLRDAVRVRIIDDSDNIWIFIEGTDSDGNLFNGYVMRKYVIFDGLTAAQRVGIIIFILAIIAGAITLKYRKPRREGKTSSERQIRL
jgi:hypothetical protein